MAGLITGAVLGLVITVLLEDYLKDRIRRAGTWLRRIRAHGPLPIATEAFTLGPLRTPTVIVEGDGEQIIDQQSIHVLVDAGQVELPDEMRAWVEEIQQEQDRKKAAGQTHFWNGPVYAVTGFSISRTPIDERPEVYLHLIGSDYFTFLAGQQLDRPFADGSTPRSRYVPDSADSTTTGFLCSSFGTNVAMVTSDNALIVQLRSNNVGSQPGTWSSSANEALSATLDSRGRTAPDIYDVMRRGISEELSIDPAEYRLEMVAFTFDTERIQWGATFVGFLHELTANDVVERRSRGVPDKWEHQDLDFVKFEIDTVIRHLLRADRIDRWSSIAPPLFYLALVRRYGRAAVERASARVIRTSGQGA
jgi:hypothetical protein